MQTAVPADSVSPTALHTEAPPLTKHLHTGGNGGTRRGINNLSPAARPARRAIGGRW